MVLQLCGRVCRRLSLWNPNLKKLGFFFFIGATLSGIALDSSPLPAGRQVCFASSAKASGLLKTLFIYLDRVFCCYFFRKNRIKFGPSSVIKRTNFPTAVWSGSPYSCRVFSTNILVYKAKTFALKDFNILSMWI